MTNLTKGSSWTNDELQLGSQISPAKENTMNLTKAFKSGYGSIDLYLYIPMGNRGREKREAK